MVAPINPMSAQPIKPNTGSAKTGMTTGAEFKNVFKNTATEWSAWVPETLAPYKEELKKKRLTDEALHTVGSDEDESDTVRSLLKKIEDRLKKLRKIAEEDNN
jgi:hypothetical protein